MFECMDVPLKNVCTASLGVTYTTYHILDKKTDYSLAVVFQNSYSFRFVPP